MLTDYGKNVRIKLFQLGKTQTWLAEQVAAKTQKFFDRPYLAKILKGQVDRPVFQSAIDEILADEAEEQKN